LNAGKKPNDKEHESKNGECLVNLLSSDNSEADGSGRHYLLLEPYGYRWFRSGGLDYILKRSSIDENRK
jgi:maltose alpha-D-glucosyltransferase / alpha-amylase